MPGWDPNCFVAVSVLLFAISYLFDYMGLRANRAASTWYWCLHRIPGACRIKGMKLVLDCLLGVVGVRGTGQLPVYVLQDDEARWV